MEPANPLARLTTVSGTFPARVLAARLASEGVAVELHGASGGPYPLPGVVEVLVPEVQLLLAREILLADAVEELFHPPAPTDRGTALAAGREARSRARRRRLQRGIRRREGR